MAGIALGAALFVALSALAAGVRGAARGPLEDVSADIVVTRPSSSAQARPETQQARGVRMPFGLAPMTADDVAIASRVPGVGRTAAALQLWEFGPRETTTIVGVDPAAPALGPAGALDGRIIDGRGLSSGAGQVAVVDLHYARFYDLRPGSTVDVGGSAFGVVGVVELTRTSQAAAANLYLPLDQAQRLAGLAPDQVNQLYAQVEAGQVDSVVRRITAALGPVSAITEDSLLQVMGGIGKVSSRFARVAGLVALAGGILLGWLAVQGLVGERRTEIGVMKAVGWRRRDVARIFVQEALVVSVVGGVVGVVLGLGGAGLLGRLSVPAAGLGPADHEILAYAGGGGSGDQRLPVRVDLGVVAAALVMVPGAGTLAGWTAARRAASLKPARALLSS